jgi:hypothetical protein
MSTATTLNQPNFKNAVEKFKSKVMTVDRQQLINCCRAYFQICESINIDGDPRRNNIVMNSSNDELRKLCFDLCMESINRDFCIYTLTGISGSAANKLYKILKAET